MRKVLALVALVALCSGCTKRNGETPGLKTLNYSFGADIKGFDPILQNDEFSGIAIQQVYEGLLQYHYLKRPFELEPLLAESMPEVSRDGRTYTFRLRPDVLFHDDPAFGGKPRRLVAADVVYSFKRLADPHLRGPNGWIFAGKVEGFDELREKLASLPPPIDYDAHDLPGFRAPDERTFVLTLKRPYRQLLYVLAMPQTRVVARELVAAYGGEFLNHAAGTGPFVLKEWVRGQRLAFERNLRYRDRRYPSEGMPGDREAGRLAAAGERIPFVDRIVIWIYPESQPRWLNFLRGRLDLAGIPKEAYDQVFDGKGEVTEEIRKRKIVVERSEGADLIYFAFNLEDPVVGRNRLLRQAISSAIDREALIRLFYNNRAVVANGPIPPSLPGFDPALRDPFGFDPERARELIRKAREKGEIPELRFETQSSTVSRQMAEAVVADLRRIGLGVRTIVNTWPQMQERIARKQAQFFMAAWQADYPDPESFLGLLYGRNVSPGTNHANFRHAEYDRLYERMRDLPDGPERLGLIARMIRIVHEETPWIFFNHRVGYGVRQAWLRNLKPAPIAPGMFQYLDIDLSERAKILPLLQ